MASRVAYREAISKSVPLRCGEYKYAKRSGVRQYDRVLMEIGPSEAGTGLRVRQRHRQL
jgi:hypothetical protein